MIGALLKVTGLWIVVMPLVRFCPWQTPHIAIVGVIALASTIIAFRIIWTAAERQTARRVASETLAILRGDQRPRKAPLHTQSSGSSNPDRAEVFP